MENGDYMGFVKVNVILKTNGGKTYTVPQIFAVDTNITEIEVVSITGKHAQIRIWRDTEDYCFYIEADKIQETFDNIYNALNHILDNANSENKDVD